MFCVFLIVSGLCVFGVFVIIFLTSIFAISEITTTYNQNLRYKPLAVDIITSNISTVTSDPLNFIEEAIAQTILINTGQSVQTSIQSNNVANMTGGVLGNNTFIYQSFTYYWADNSTNGVTGTKIDGVWAPVEVRVMFMNSKYNTISKAVNNPDGLAEIVFLLNICSTFNQAFDQLSQSIQNLTTVLSSTPVSLGTQFSAVDITSTPFSQPAVPYYSYQGSFVDTVTSQTHSCSTVIVPKLEAQNSCITSDQFTATFTPVKNTFGQPFTNTLSPDTSTIQFSMYPSGFISTIYYY